MELSKLLPEKQYQVYESIDTLPKWNWDQIHKTDNYIYLKILPSYRKVEQDKSKNLLDLWEDIYNEFIEEFDFSAGYKNLIDKKKRLANLQNQYIQTGNRLLLNSIRIAQVHIDEDEKEAEGSNLELRDAIKEIEKHQGIKMNVREVTVADFYTYMKTMKKNGKN